MNRIHINRRVLLQPVIEDCVDRSCDDLRRCLLDRSSGFGVLDIAQPIHRCTPAYQSPCGLINLFKVEDLLLFGLASIRDLSPAENTKQSPQLIPLIVRGES
jgi:hypothetical protein